MIQPPGPGQVQQPVSSSNGSILAGTIASSSVTMAGTGAAHSALAKPLLPYSITPPRQNGPSEAERKIEALTKQLEEELEKEEESEYFGKIELFLIFSEYKIIV
jgi:hypothetical protein